VIAAGSDGSDPEMKVDEVEHGEEEVVGGCLGFSRIQEKRKKNQLQTQQTGDGWLPLQQLAKDWTDLQEVYRMPFPVQIVN
jgi:hypothetical protein